MSIKKLQSLGQSLWYDNIQRRLLENGGLADLIQKGEIRGVTSNPSIFLNAIARSRDYDAALLPLAWSGWQAEPIFWQLAMEDIRAACDLFAPLYRGSEGADGYVSLEVNPTLAHDSDATLAQVKHLWQTVDRPNLMVKIPATPEGLPAIRAAIAAGINVNVTLIFSLERYRQVMDAYLAGLQERLEAGLPVGGIASVASFFVSRMDTKLDARLEALGTPEALALRGQAAIAYSRLAYEEFRRVFGGERFAPFQASGCRLQRPLWASTSTKNPAYRDTMYVEALIGPATVDTVPPQTLDAFRDHGKVAATLAADPAGAARTIAAVEALGISMGQVTDELEQEGVKAFSDSFKALLAAIEDRRLAACSALGPLGKPVERRVARLVAEGVPARIWSHDPSLWTSELAGQEEVRKRMGWLDLPLSSRTGIKEIVNFAGEIRADGLKRVLLLGMGGSSLAPEVMSQVLALPPESPAFAILDSTDPAQVRAAAEAFPPLETLYLVSSKSGGTAEVSALFAYFWGRACEALGEKAGSRFAAVTDPGTSLDALANARGFRKTFLADPTVGGRFSALSHFGLVPAGLMGLDLEDLLERAAWMMRQCAADAPGPRNPGLVLGAILGQAALDGRNKLTILADESLAPLGAWLEQLIAESSGKQGRGLVVVDREPPADPATYGRDRLFVHLRREGELDERAAALQAAGAPVLTLSCEHPFDLGAEIYRWEVATAVACSIMGVNAFDQPDVQDSKTRTLEKLDAYSHEGRLVEGKPLWEDDNLRLYSPASLKGSRSKSILDKFLASARKGDYLAINAYLPRNPEMTAALTGLRKTLLSRTGCATTLGFGPRFLHSTGQLHKGGPDTGLFLEITADPVEDLDIPDQKYTFGVLERAQALGDYEALAARGRRLLRLHFKSRAGLMAWVRSMA